MCVSVAPHTFDHVLQALGTHAARHAGRGGHAWRRVDLDEPRPAHGGTINAVSGGALGVSYIFTILFFLRRFIKGEKNRNMLLPRTKD